ncbi:leucine-rich repeat protein [Faecalibacterium sp. DFI.5.82]|uniref:leucine-rich repeat protein n=1 Tax=Faecalibacterium sp. DFI.5.82 TaxID=3031725 RepID=UPI0023AF866B|nr:leucine-rich repeat protein [Faecalibacterium sp. DFI.5.82]MDE8690913.1 leucine-rich repeat protein [Faecalibacterium sp. DFI.5.82]
MKPKRLISLLVAVCMMITMLPLSAVTAFAADTATEQEAIVDGYKYKYKVNGGNATITKFLGPVKPTNYDYDIDIPETLDDKYTVTAIGNYAFYSDHQLGEVTIPQSVTSIGDHAFAGCRNLNSLTINDAATSIGNRAFTECPLTTTLSLGKKITTIDDRAFYDCRGLTSVTIPPSVTSIGDHAFGECIHLKTLSFGENSFGENIETNITTIGNYAFFHCNDLESVTIPQSVTSIGREAFRFCNNMKSLAINGAIESMGTGAFAGCISLEKISLGENIKTIGYSAFDSCTSINLTNVTIPENVTTIRPGTFRYCTHLEYITLPAGLTSFQDSLKGCPAGNPNGAIYYKNYKAKADALLADNDNNPKIDANDKLRKRNFLYLCKVTFDAKGGELNDDAVVPVYKTEKITDTKANDLTAIHDPTRAGYKFTGWYTEDGNLFNVKDTAIMEDITLHAGWEFDPNAPGCHPLTVTGGTVTVKYDGSDVTSKLNSNTDAATGQKTYDVPDNAEVTVTLDKDRTPAGMVFDGWSTGEFSLPQDQNYKAESITFPMSSGVDIAAQYRDAAADHTHDTAVFHPLTVTGGIVTVKNGDKDVTDTLTVTTDETTGKKTYSVPDGATVTVTLDKTLIPEGMVFDIWSTGKFSLPLGQDYKAESITFTMNTMSSDVDIAAQYRDATIEDDGPNVLGTAAIIGTAAVGGAVLGYQAYSLGAEFAGKLMALPYFPSNRSALAMMLWEDAGKPMPESELLYPDVEQEEQDMDLQHAARWAMENELIPDLNDEGTAPEEMKFFPANPVSKLDVLNAWQKAQELKNN